MPAYSDSRLLAEPSQVTPITPTGALSPGETGMAIYVRESATTGHWDLKTSS